MVVATSVTEATHPTVTLYNKLSTPQVVITLSEDSTPNSATSLHRKSSKWAAVDVGASSRVMLVKKKKGVVAEEVNLPRVGNERTP